MNQPMSSSEQSLVYGFLVTAAMYRGGENVLRAGRRAGSLLRRILDGDTHAIREVTALCDAAAEWQGWQDSALRVRMVLQARADRRRPADDDERSRVSADAVEHEAAARLALLDVWLATSSKPLAEFFALWEPAEDPDDASD
jgi:hypothetical protein